MESSASQSGLVPGLDWSNCCCCDREITQPLQTFNKSEKKRSTHKSKMEEVTNLTIPRRHTCRTPRYIYRIASSPFWPLHFTTNWLSMNFAPLASGWCYKIWPLCEHLAGTWKIPKKGKPDFRPVGGNCSSHPLTCHAHVRIIYTQYFFVLPCILPAFHPRNWSYWFLCQAPAKRTQSLTHKCDLNSLPPHRSSVSSRLAASAVIHQKQMSAGLVSPVLHGSCKYVHLIALNSGAPQQPRLVFWVEIKVLGKHSVLDIPKWIIFSLFVDGFVLRAFRPELHLPNAICPCIPASLNPRIPLNCKLITQSKQDIWDYNYCENGMFV